MSDKEKQIFNFSVIDNKTGEYPDLYNIALKEDWAKGLMYCDMEGFAILEDGNLVLLDECGKWECCPSGRFAIITEDSVVLTREEYKMMIETQKHLEKKYSDMRDELNFYKNANEIVKQNYIQLKQDNEQARKKTVKELLTAQLKECIEAEKRILKIRKSKDDLYYNGFSLAITNLKMYIKELAKEYGVEIGEEV